MNLLGISSNGPEIVFFLSLAKYPPYVVSGFAVSLGELTGGIIYQERQKIDTFTIDNRERSTTASTTATLGRSGNTFLERTTIDISFFPLQPDWTQLLRAVAQHLNVSQLGTHEIKSGSITQFFRKGGMELTCEEVSSIGTPVTSPRSR